MVNSTSGFYHDLAQLLAESLNFKLINKRPPDGKFGAPNATAAQDQKSDPETWSGLVRMLMVGEADFSASGVTATLERSRAIDFAIIAVSSKFIRPIFMS